MLEGIWKHLVPSFFFYLYLKKVKVRKVKELAKVMAWVNTDLVLENFNVKICITLALININLRFLTPWKGENKWKKTGCLGLKCVIYFICATYCQLECSEIRVFWLIKSLTKNTLFPLFMLKRFFPEARVFSDLQKKTMLYLNK